MRRNHEETGNRFASMRRLVGVAVSHGKFFSFSFFAISSISHHGTYLAREVSQECVNTTTNCMIRTCALVDRSYVVVVCMASLGERYKTNASAAGVRKRVRMFRVILYVHAQQYCNNSINSTPCNDEPVCAAFVFCFIFLAVSTVYHSYQYKPTY